MTQVPISSPPLLRTHIFVKFLCQLLDVPQDFLLVPLFCTHALHFISNELEGGEAGERSSSPLGRIPPPSPCPSSIPKAARPGSAPQPSVEADPQPLPWDGAHPTRSHPFPVRVARCGVPAGTRGAAHLIEQVDGTVRGTPLGHEARERHALQHLGEEVVLRQPPLPQEGCLQQGSTELSAARGAPQHPHPPGEVLGAGLQGATSSQSGYLGKNGMFLRCCCGQSSRMSRVQAILYRTQLLHVIIL